MQERAATSHGARMPSTHRSVCRFCHAHCAILVDVEDGRAVRVVGDKDDPLYAGFTCAKGRELPRAAREPEERLLHSQKRGADGTLRADRERAGDSARSRSACAASSTRARPARGRALHGTYSLPYPARAQPMTPGMHGRDRLADALHVEHDRPAGQAVALALHGSWGARRDRPSTGRHLAAGRASIRWSRTAAACRMRTPARQLQRRDRSAASS